MHKREKWLMVFALASAVFIGCMPWVARADSWHTSVASYETNFGNRLGCGQYGRMTSGMVGVAHKSLPCGTLVRFRNPKTGQEVVAKVMDRGPYVRGREWDLFYATCKAISHCYTGSVEWTR